MMYWEKEKSKSAEKKPSAVCLLCAALKLAVMGVPFQSYYRCTTNLYPG